MIVTERISRDLKIEYDSEVPRIAFYYSGDEIESTTIEPFKTKILNLIKSIDFIEQEKQK